MKLPLAFREGLGQAVDASLCTLCSGRVCPVWPAERFSCGGVFPVADQMGQLLFRHFGTRSDFAGQTRQSSPQPPTRRGAGLLVVAGEDR